MSTKPKPPKELWVFMTDYQKAHFNQEGFYGSLLAVTNYAESGERVPVRYVLPTPKRKKRKAT